MKIWINIFPDGWLPFETQIIKNKINIDRFTELYNHLIKSCSIWKFPMNDNLDQSSPVWDVTTCTRYFCKTNRGIIVFRYSWALEKLS